MQARTFLLSFSLALCAGAAVAQTYTAHPIDNLASGVSQNIPIAGGSTSWDEARSQFLWPAAFLPSSGGVITGIEWVPITNYATPYERFELWLDMTTNATLSTTFANNLSNPVLVYSQSPGSIQWTANTWNQIQFQTPFFYDGVHNLVLEIRKVLDRPNNATITSVSHRVLATPRRADLPTPIWAYGTYGSGAVNALVAQATYNTQVLTRFVWQGTRTLTIDSTRDVTGNGNRSYFHIGATLTASVRGSPSEFFFCGIDVSLSPFPLPFPPVSGALWLPTIELINSGLLDGSGRGNTSITIPSNPNLIGLRAFFQGMVVGSGLLFTNVVDAPVAAY